MSSQLYSKDALVGRTAAAPPGNIYSPDTFSKSQAKAELQAISTRLGNYIQYVREISENANQVDLEAFVNSIKILEQELVNMKNIYEKELGTARQEGDDLSRTKNQLQQENNKLKDHIAELENRLGVEVDKGRQAVNDINTLQHTLIQKEQELTQAKLAIQKPISDLDQLTAEFQAVLREKEECKRRFEQEQLVRQELQDKNGQQQKKIDIDTQVHDQEVQDLNDRLNAASTTVLKLEAKIREMTHADTALSEMLARVREVAEGEIQRYQQESEARFSQNVSELQSQINEGNRKIADLNERNQQLHMEIGDYQSENRSLQGQVTSLTHQRAVLEDELATDRRRSHEQIRLLENKLVQLQDNIISKMKDLNAARDAQIPLKAEIETLRSMMEEEERRLRLPASPRLDYDLTSSPIKPHVSVASVHSNAANSSAFDPPDKFKYTPSRTGSGLAGTGPLFTPAAAPLEPSPRPLGPVRVRSAPVSKPHLVPSSLGQGQDYFDEMFNDLQVREMRGRLGLNEVIPAPAPAAENDAEQIANPDVDENNDTGSNTRKSSAKSYEYATYNSSAVGDLKILEVSPDGSYVRLLNSAVTKEAELGGFMIQQNVGGHPVSVFRFPPRVRIPAGEAVTVWASCSEPTNHSPPTDFYFKEQEKWGTGPECTTILCKANGQAVAWTTASQRFTQNAYHKSASSITSTGNGDNSNGENTTQDPVEPLPVYDMNVNAAPKEPVYLRREKESPPSLIAQKHPHGVSPPSPTHPHTSQARPLTYGNDNSTRSRQSRAQSTRPDPIPGAPYAGASAQRMGSASLRRYTPTQPTTTIRGSGALANKSSDPPGTVTSRPPSAFQTPHNRFSTGLKQIQSQHNDNFQPDMPRPPLISSW